MNSNFTKKRIIVEARKTAINNIKKCFYPGCNEKSINSHILQRKGILDKISTNSHLWTFRNNHQKNELEFKRVGLKKAFAFHCFCNHHDTELFKEIETTDIDFTKYRTMLLFTLRVLYDEIYKKIVFVETCELILDTNSDLFDKEVLITDIEDGKLAISDLKRIEQKIILDLEQNTEHFVFKKRDIPRIDFCVSTFFTYDTTEEIEKLEEESGRKLDRYTEMFISIFPYQQGNILLMGYEKIDDVKVKDYFDEFFIEENPELCYKKITNLLIFNCENKVFGDQFYSEKIEGIESKHIEATEFMLDKNNKNERTSFEINFYNEDFKQIFSALKFK
ncbi:hypothetical protein GSF70_10150 [Flavobacteriaceae bacterium W22]|nr:hypothetical protein [Flavobacteriaceae bacterium W22]